MIELPELPQLSLALCEPSLPAGMHRAFWMLGGEAVTLCGCSLGLIPCENGPLWSLQPARAMHVVCTEKQLTLNGIPRARNGHVFSQKLLSVSKVNNY